jgi:hypothetical protein
MAITHEDIQVLKQEFDERYVLQSDCDNVQSEMNSKFSSDDKKLAVLDLKMTACLWLMGIIASGLVALVIKAYLG